MARFVTGSSGKNGRTSEGPSEAGADFAGEYPAITEYMTLDVLDDGGYRQRATLQFLVEDGVWKACLNDRQAHRSCWVSAVSLRGCLVSLEEALASGTPSWRHYQPWGKAKRKGS